ncbi:MAG: hypothetical protein ACK4HB_04070 [Candidatus Bipolaricaulia bacterium]
MRVAKFLMIVGLMVAALAVPSWASGNEVKGTLNAVDVAAMTVTVNNQVYSVSANVVVKVKNQGYIPFSQLPTYVGQWVELKLDSQGLVYKIEVKSSAGGGGSTKVKGTLNAVDVAGLTVTVNGQLYAVSANVVVKVEKQGYIPFSQLPNYIGRQVELKLSNSVVYEIEVKSSSGGGGKSGKLKGTLQAVDTSNRTITVNNQTFSVSANVVIEVKQGKQKSYISFEQLPSYIGKLVEIKYDANKVVYKIEVKS